MFVPFVPIPPPSSIPSVSPKDGKNFNDSWEDSRDLIGNCDCHSRDLGLFGRNKRRRRRWGEESYWGTGGRKKNLGFVQTKKWTGFCIKQPCGLDSMWQPFEHTHTLTHTILCTNTAHTGGLQPVDSVEYRILDEVKLFSYMHCLPLGDVCKLYV